MSKIKWRKKKKRERSKMFSNLNVFFNLLTLRLCHSVLNIQHVLNIKQMLIQTIVFHLQPDLPELLYY